MYKFALVTSNNSHRYFLSRIWDTELPVCICIMINPSYADHIEDDQTVLKLIRICKFNEFGGFNIINLFDLISIYISDLEGKSMEDLVLPITLTFHQSLFGNILKSRRNTAVLCAWGDGIHSIRPMMEKRIAYFSDLFTQFQITPTAVKINKSGMPGHPLYLPDNSKFNNFNLRCTF